MAGKKNKIQVNQSRLMAVAVLVIACVCVLFLVGGQNKLDNVEVQSINGEITAQQKDEIIRASTLKMGAQIDSISEIEKQIAAGVNSTGFARFENAERISNKTIRLTVSLRTPVAVVAAGGNYILIDKDGMVMNVYNTMPPDQVLYVTGADVSNYSRGKTLSMRNESQLEDIIRIAGAIQSLGYHATYSELNVKDLKDIYLVTNTNLIVEIFDGKNIEQTLKMVDEIIKSGGVKGKITISGDYAGYRKEE